MQGGLTVEDHIVAVLEVALNGVANLQMLVRAVRQHRQVDEFTVKSLYELGAGVICSALNHEPAHVIHVLGSDDLWNCHVHSDLLGYAKLVKHQVRVTCDNGTSREITSLAHKVASEAALLAL